MTLGPNSRIEGAEVNDEVSRRVLSYVAPVLDRATRVNGRVSASFTKAEFPIGPDLAGKARVEGKVVFDDVAFEPGPLAENIMALAGREARTITLDEPVLLTIADGKVHQEGLKVPIGNLTEFAVRGDVGFDESLDLTASIPMTAQMFKDMPVVGSIVDGARVNVPIGGTLSKPRIDRDEFRAQLKVLERDLLQRTATRGAAELLFRLAQPRPRGEDGLTPRERRQQRRMERRQQREQRSTP
jgi:translocation and assembly module TamB